MTAVLVLIFGVEGVPAEIQMGEDFESELA